LDRFEASGGNSGALSGLELANVWHLTCEAPIFLAWPSIPRERQVRLRRLLAVLRRAIRRANDFACEGDTRVCTDLRRSKPDNRHAETPAQAFELPLVDPSLARRRFRVVRQSAISPEGAMLVGFAVDEVGVKGRLAIGVEIGPVQPQLDFVLPHDEPLEEVIRAAGPRRQGKHLSRVFGRRLDRVDVLFELSTSPDRFHTPPRLDTANHHD